MRKITLKQIICYATVLISNANLASYILYTIYHLTPENSFKAIVTCALWAIMLFSLQCVAFRFFQLIKPLPMGDIEIGSKEEFIYHIYLLFFLTTFTPVIRMTFLPVPLLRTIYSMLGAKWGQNTYTAGIVLDPTLVQIGQNTLLGANSLIIPHAIEGEKLSHHPIHIGNHVTIGANAVILPGVTIGDHAMIAAGAVVKKNAFIPPNEIWAGIPARCIKHVKETNLTKLVV